MRGLQGVHGIFGDLVVAAGAATEQMSTLGPEPTATYQPLPPSTGTDTFPAVGEEEDDKKGPAVYILLGIAAVGGSL